MANMRICRPLILVLLRFFPGLFGLRHINVISMCVGGKNPQIGFEIMGSVIDVAMEFTEKLYPRVFSSTSRINHFVDGRFTCAEAEAITTASLGILIGCEEFTKTCHEKNGALTVILAPGKLHT